MIVEVRNLKKIYLRDTPSEVQALRGVDLEVDVGEFISIMGASGSGKSTLLNILGCMDKSTEGSVRIENTEVTAVPQSQLSRIRKEKIGFVFQDIYLINNLRAIDNVLAPLIPYGISKKDRKRAEDLLKDAGLGNRINHSPNQLSGGEKQRVAICRALINNPKIILADEPTGNLDTKTGTEILNLLRKINQEQGTTIIVVTHDPKVAEYSSRNIIFRDGQIIEDKRNNISN
jgi:putative ABC transport system ATP-binding protein